MKSIGNRREFLKQLGLGFAAAVVPVSGVSGASNTAKPNIILIMADDLGYECLGCNGSTFYKTPRLDAMARTGLRFTNCHSQPVCTPSRVKIMTGRFNSRNYRAFGCLDPGEQTFGNILKNAGYTTCIAGKWQLFGRGKEYPGTNPTQAGFDEYCLWEMDEQTSGSRYWNPTIRQNGRMLDGLSDAYGPDVFCRFILDFVEKNGSKPFFVYYPMALTHGPHIPTPDSKQGDKNTKRDTKYFPEMVTYADKIIGRILDRLKDLDLQKNTLVLFTGDNGTDKKVTSQFKGRQIRGGKGRAVDAGTHVPLIAYWKGATPAGRACEDLIDFSDFLPTFVEMSEATLPDKLTLDGRSFLPQIKGLRGNPKEYILCYYEKGKYEIESSQPKSEKRLKKDAKAANNKAKGKLPYSRFVRDARWKLNGDGKLFDVLNDPTEQDPVESTAPQVRAIRKKFEAALNEFSPEKQYYRDLAKRTGE